MLLERGARVTVSDVDGNRARDAVDRFGADAVPVEETLSTGCDIVAPCAVGAVLNERSIPRLRCGIVAGAANNQLATPDDDRRLRDAGILYAPDFVINAGGVLHGVGLEIWGWTEAQFREAAGRIGHILTEVYHAADERGVGTYEAAEALARSRLSASPGGGPPRR